MLRQIHSLSISDKMARDLQLMAMSGMPNEICGVVHAHNIIHQYPNTFSGDHKHGFDMEVDIKDDTIKAIWHSHPGGLASPSRDDIPCMQHLAEHGFIYPWLIITAKSVTEWIYESWELLSKCRK